MIAVIGHDFVAERIETSGDSMAAKICRVFREVDDCDQRGFGKLWISDAFYIFLWLRGDTLAYPELTCWSGFIEREAISLGIECLPHGFRDRAGGQRTIHLILGSNRQSAQRAPATRESGNAVDPVRAGPGRFGNGGLPA